MFSHKSGKMDMFVEGIIDANVFSMQDDVSIWYHLFSKRLRLMRRMKAMLEVKCKLQ